VSAIALTLIMSVYNNISKSFFVQTHRAIQISRMALAKKQIEHTMQDVAVIVSIQQDQFDYKTNNSDVIRSVKFVNNVLQGDTSTIVQHITAFRCFINQKTGASASVLLLWEAEIDSGWIGGAKKVSIIE
jgi:hypothetical protein